MQTPMNRTKVEWVEFAGHKVTSGRTMRAMSCRTLFLLLAATPR